MKRLTMALLGALLAVVVMAGTALANDSTHIAGYTWHAGTGVPLPPGGGWWSDDKCGTADEQFVAYFFQNSPAWTYNYTKVCAPEKDFTTVPLSKAYYDRLCDFGNGCWVADSLNDVTTVIQVFSAGGAGHCIRPYQNAQYTGNYWTLGAGGQYSQPGDFSNDVISAVKRVGC